MRETRPCDIGNCTSLNKRTDALKEHDKLNCGHWAMILAECGIDMQPGDCPYPAMAAENRRALNDPDTAVEAGLGELIGIDGIGVDEQVEDLL